MYLLVRITETHHDVLFASFTRSVLLPMLEREIKDGHKSYIRYKGDYRE
jgi:hypothetical protein